MHNQREAYLMWTLDRKDIVKKLNMQMNNSWNGTKVENWLNHITGAQFFYHNQKSWDIIDNQKTQARYQIQNFFFRTNGVKAFPNKDHGYATICLKVKSMQRNNLNIDLIQNLNKFIGNHAKNKYYRQFEAHISWFKVPLESSGRVVAEIQKTFRDFFFSPTDLRLKNLSPQNKQNIENFVNQPWRSF